MELTPERQIRAVFDDRTIRVYQAYADPIADAALAKGSFGPPFKMSRMTWIKPSFLWMMYRCGWGRKEGQNRILAIDITREGFEWALAHSCLSHFEKTTHGSDEAWKAALQSSPVRIQWDPERTLALEPEKHRSLQVGLSGEAVERYVRDWTRGITEVTAHGAAVHEAVTNGDLAEAEARLPSERPYPLPPAIAARIGMLPPEA